MNSLYQAYQAYERKAERGEFSAAGRGSGNQRASSNEPILSQLGDVLIRAGLRLKHRSLGGKPMAWSPMTGSKS